MSNLEEILEDKIVCCNSRKDRVIFFSIVKVRGVYTKTLRNMKFLLKINSD